MQVMELNKGSKEAWNCLGNNDDTKDCNKDASVLDCNKDAGVLDCNKDSGVLYKQHLGAGPGPSGLHLRKSSSLVNMIQMELNNQASKEKGRHTRSDAYRGCFLDTTSVTKTILKPSQFYASILRIGTWEWKSKYDGDLVAKFYYTNGKMIWEILSRELKSKIEIDWQTISGLKVNCRESEPGTLEIMLSQVPIFCKETNPQPRMSTKWRRSVDFTDGQASMHRRHFLQCAPGILHKHIVKLLSSNHRLYSLRQKNAINQRKPLFEQFHSEHKVAESSRSIQDLHCHYNFPQFEQQKFGVPVSMSIETNTVGRNRNESQDTMHVLVPSSVPFPNNNPMIPSGDLQFHRDMFTCNNSWSCQTPPQAQFDTLNGRIPKNTANCMINPSKPPRQNLLTSIGAPSSSLVRPEDVRKFINETRPTNQLISPGIPFIYSDDSLNQNTRELSLSNYAFNGPRNLPSSDDAQFAATSLEKISHDLLNDTYNTDAMEETVIMSRVNSFSSLLHQDPTPAANIEAEAPAQVLDVAPPGSSGGSCTGGEGDNGLLPWEQELALWDIDMDMGFLSDFPTFSP